MLLTRRTNRLLTLLASAAAWALAACGGSSTPIDLGNAAGNVLSLSSTTGAFEARVVNADGSPHANQTVQLAAVATRATSLELTTDANGIVRAGSLKPGTYSLLLAAANLQLNVKAGDVTQQRFDLGSPGTPTTGLGLLYVVNGLGRTLSVVDIYTGVVTNNVLQTGQFPNDIQFHLGLGYVVNSGDNAVQVFDPVTVQDLATFSTGEGANPWNIHFPSATQSYVSNWLGNSLWWQTYTNGVPTASGTVADVGQGPEGMLGVGGKLYVCLSGYNSATFGFDMGGVAVVDTATNQVLSTIEIGQGTDPQMLVQGADGMLYVLATGSSTWVQSGDQWIQEPSGSSVYRIDPSTDTVVGDPLALAPVNGVNTSVGAFALAPNGRLFCVDSKNNVMHVIDTQTATVLMTGGQAIATGTNPLGVSATANGRIWVYNFNDDAVSVYDADTYAVVFGGGTALQLGDGPQFGASRAAGASSVGLAVR